MRTASLILSLVALAALLSSCARSLSEAAEIRVIALTYAFDHDRESMKELDRWLFVVAPDEESESVLAALANYPISRGVLQVEDRASTVRVDRQSGKRVAHWRVRIEEKGSGEVWADVGCVKGRLNGYGQMLRMKKQLGRWVIVSCTPTWIS